MVGKNIRNVSMKRFCTTFLPPEKECPKNSGEIDVFLLQIRSSQPRLSRGDGGDAPFCFGQGRVSVVSL